MEITDLLPLEILKGSAMRAGDEAFMASAGQILLRENVLLILGLGKGDDLSALDLFHAIAQEIQRVRLTLRLWGWLANSSAMTNPADLFARAPGSRRP